MTRGQVRNLQRLLGVAAVAVLLLLLFDRMSGTASSAPTPTPGPAPTGSASDGTEQHARSMPTSPQLPPSLTSAHPGESPSGEPFAGLMPQVGALFSVDGNGNPTQHFCTASVVDSPQGNVIATAAHCVIDPSSGQQTQPFVFVPGYHDGKSPYGWWQPVKVLVDPRWSGGGNPDYDIAFVVVQKVGVKAGQTARSLQDTVGADRIAFGSGEPGTVAVVGYPGSADRPIACLNATKPYNPNQSEFDCAGFEDGSSGGPLLHGLDPATGTGTLVGVIGGYQEGGDSADVSYAAHFGADIRTLYEEAAVTGG